MNNPPTKQDLLDKIAALEAEVATLEARLMPGTIPVAQLIGERTLRIEPIRRLDARPAQMNYIRGWNACLRYCQTGQQ